MFSSIGISDLLVILIVALILFVPSKLPELGQAFGQTLTELKNTEIMRKKEKHGKVHT